MSIVMEKSDCKTLFASAPNCQSRQMSSANRMTVMRFASLMWAHKLNRYLSGDEKSCGMWKRSRRKMVAFLTELVYLMLPNELKRIFCGCWKSFGGSNVPRNCFNSRGGFFCFERRRTRRAFWQLNRNPSELSFTSPKRENSNEKA